MANKLEEMNKCVKAGWDFVFLGDKKFPNVDIMNSVYPDMVRLRIPKSEIYGQKGLDLEVFNIDLLNTLKDAAKDSKRKFVLFENFKKTSELARIAEVITERKFDSIPVSDNVVFGVYGLAEEFGYKEEVIGSKQFFARLVDQINQRQKMDMDR